MLWAPAMLKEYTASSLLNLNFIYTPGSRTDSTAGDQLLQLFTVLVTLILSGGAVAMFNRV